MTDDEGVWITTSPNPDGSYSVDLVFGPDHVHRMDPALGGLHIAGLLSEILGAEYEAGMFAQFQMMHFSHDDMRPLLARFRQLRREKVDKLPKTDVPMTFQGLVTIEGEPVIHVVLGGEVVGALDLDEARRHVYGILEAGTASTFEAMYRQILTADVGLEDDKAVAMVAHLAELVCKDDVPETP